MVTSDEHNRLILTTIAALHDTDDHELESLILVYAEMVAEEASLGRLAGKHFMVPLARFCSQS